MRLLHTKTLQLHDFTNRVPPYACFLYTWGDDDINIKDMSDPEAASKKPGYSVLQSAISRALAYGLGYLWVDALCIDRTSSAELAETINSLYDWYWNARICFLCLRDLEVNDESATTLTSQLAQSAWFRRTWMLQELLAPRTLEFFDRNWNYIGTKASLLSTLAAITNIDVAALSDPLCIGNFSVGQRMSWAAGLLAIRPEDTAYSLLGIFGVNMPIIYGEGHRSFLRLQEEILKDTADATLFAWQSTDKQMFRGLLAKSPLEFAHFGTRFASTQLGLPYIVQSASGGIFVDGVFGAWGTDRTMTLCLYESESTSFGYGIVLCEWNGRWVRCMPQQLTKLDGLATGSSKRIFIVRELSSRAASTMSKYFLSAQSRDLVILSRSLPTRKRDVGGELILPTRPAAPCNLEATQTQQFNVTSTQGDEYQLVGSDGPTSHTADRNDNEDHYGVESSDGESAFDAISSSSDAEESYDMASSTCSIRETKNSGHVQQFKWFKYLGELTRYGLEQCADWVLQFQTGSEGSDDTNRSPRAGKRLKAAGVGEIALQSDSEEETVLVTVRDAVTAYYACHYYLRDPKAHRECLRFGLSSLLDVRRHLLASHMRPFYCPVCREIFDTATLCDDHIKARTCSLQTGLPFEGMTDYQARQLSRKSTGLPSAEEEWYRIWEIIFDDAECPGQPYLTGDVEWMIGMVRDFWAWDGHRIVRDGLEIRHKNIFRLSERVEAASTLRNTILQEMVDKLLSETDAMNCAKNARQSTLHWVVDQILATAKTIKVEE